MPQGNLKLFCTRAGGIAYHAGLAAKSAWLEVGEPEGAKFVGNRSFHEGAIGGGVQQDIGQGKRLALFVHDAALHLGLGAEVESVKQADACEQQEIE